MYEGKLVFSQVMDHAPQHLFRKCVKRYSGNRYVKSFPCWSQFLCMAFAQLTYRASLRDIEISLRAHGRKLYHMGIHGKISRNHAGQSLVSSTPIFKWRFMRTGFPSYSNVLLK